MRIHEAGVYCGGLFTRNQIQAGLHTVGMGRRSELRCWPKFCRWVPIRRDDHQLMQKISSTLIHASDGHAGPGHDRTLDVMVDLAGLIGQDSYVGTLSLPELVLI